MAYYGDMYRSYYYQPTDAQVAKAKVGDVLVAEDGTRHRLVNKDPVTFQRCN